MQRPDADAYYKAAQDAFFKEDNIVWDFRASKFWVDMQFGWIDIELGTLPPAKGFTKISLATDELK